MSASHDGVLPSLTSILLAYDGFAEDEDPPALALDLAREHAALLHAVHVMTPPPLPAWKWGNVSSTELHEALVTERVNRLTSLVGVARRAAIDGDVSVRTGVPHVEIIREAMKVGADLVVVTDQSARRAGRRGFGAVTTKLRRKCPVPVLAKRVTAKRKHERIMAAVDVTSKAPEVVELNRRIVGTAASLAKRSGAELVLFHAWFLFAERLLRSEARLSDRQVNDFLEHTERLRGDRLEALAELVRAEGVEVRVELVKGLPRDLLPELVALWDVDLVVMGTVSRGGLEGFVIGNTAERILNALPCSVLAVKPEGFRSPVTAGSEGAEEA